jgi:hypothetical protein
MMEIVFFFILAPIITILWLLLVMLFLDVYREIRK